MNIENDNMSNIPPPIIDSKIIEMEKEIRKIKNWSDKDIQELMNILSVDEINTLLLNEIQRIDDWFSKTYYNFKSYLIKNNLIKFNKNELERLKNKMDFVSSCLNEDTNFQQNIFYPNEIMDSIKTMEKNRYDKFTIQIIGKTLARCLLCMRNVNGNVYDHVLGAQHQTNLCIPALIELLDSFHAGWHDIPISLRVNELFFLPHSITRTKCCICNSVIGYRELLVHVNGKNHIVKIPEEFKHSEEKLIDNQKQCGICKILVSQNRYEEHVKGRNHQKKLKQLEKVINDKMLCEVCNFVISRVGYHEHVKGTKHQINLKLLNGKLDNNKYECDICKTYVTSSRDALQEHINGKNHLENVYKLYLNQSSVKELNEKFDTENQVKCEICQVYFSKDEFEKHIDGNYHQTNLKLISLKYIEKKPENNEFYCKVCQIRVSGGLQEHINGKNHLSNLKILNDGSNSKITPEATTETSNQFKCDVCSIVVTWNELQEHINERNHQMNLEQLNLKQGSFHNQVKCDHCNHEVNLNAVQEHINEKNHQMNLEQFKKLISNHDNVKCDVCNIVVARKELKEHIIGIDHLTRLKQLNLLSALTVRINGELVHCVICKIVVTHGGLQEHVDGKNHQTNLKQLNPIVMEEKKLVNKIECEICKILVRRDGLQQHINSEYHQMILNQKSIVETNDNQDQSNLNQVQDNVKCDVCNIVIARKELKEHIIGINHLTNLKQLNLLSALTVGINGELVHCVICKIVVTHGGLQEHVDGKNHQTNLKQLNPIVMEEKKLVNKIECEICKILVRRDGLQQHINSEYHQMILNQKSIVETNDNQDQSNLNQVQDNVKCDVCNIVIARKELKEHIIGINHLTRLKQLNLLSALTVRINGELVHCVICKIVVTHGGLQEHVDGKNHQTNLKQLNPIVMEEKKLVNKIECEICKILVRRDGLQQHINSEYHQMILNQKSIVETNDNQDQSNLNQVSVLITEEIDENQVQQCTICKVIVSRNSLEEHINERDHQTILYEINTKYNSKRFVGENSKYFCVICNIEFPYRRLSWHSEKPNHQENLIKINLHQLKSINEKLTDILNDTKRIVTKDVISSSKLSDVNLLEYITDFYTLQLSKIVPRPLTIQKVGSIYFRCLACKIMFIEVNSLNLHVSSEFHQYHYNREKIQSALKTYHKVWETVVPESIHSQQIYFFPLDNQAMFCQICLEVVDTFKVKKHCKNKLHLRTIIDGNLWQEIGESVYHKESDRIENNLFSLTNTFIEENVFHLTEQFYSDDLLQKFDKKSHRLEKIILMSSPGMYNCLICHTKNIPSPLLERHCLSLAHCSSIKSRFQNDIVRQFHQDWSNIPADLQLHQIYFLPNYGSYTCLCCGNDSIRFTDMLRHIYGSQHLKKLKLLNPSEIPTNESVKLTLYPESITALLKEINDNPDDCISFQKYSLFEVKCLVCKIKFENIPSHFLSKEHKKLMQNREIIKAVKKYHSEWKKIPENLQFQQLNYEPYDETQIMCNKCKIVLLYDNLYYHLTNDHKFIESRKTIPISNTKSEKKIISSPKTSNQDKKFAPFTYYPIHLLQKMRKLEGKIYRNVQMIGESSFRCLLCRLFVCDLDEHISNSDHLKFLSDKKLISSVEKFHNSWATIDNNLQFQQMYFFPSNETMLSCALCIKDINYNKLVTHLQNSLHSCLNGLKTSESLSSLNSNNPNLNSSTSLNSLSKINGADSTDSNLNEDEDSESVSSDESSDESDTEKVKNQLKNLDIGGNDNDIQQNLKLKEIWNNLSERFKVHSTVVYWKNGIFSCHLCHVNLEPNEDDIIAHVIRATHIVVFKTTGLYQRQWDKLVYECLYCNKKIQRSENDWQTHLKSKKHNELRKQNNFENFVEMQCKTCKTVLYGDKNILRDHKHAGRKDINKAIKMPPYLQLLFKSSENVNTFIQKIYDEAMEVLSLSNQDEKVCEDLIDAIKPFCKNLEKCKAYRFGSRVTGICTHDSDLDVFLDLNDVYNGSHDQEPDLQASYVDYTHLILVKLPKIWSHFEPIRQARTPILRVYHQPTKIDCDISFRNGLSVENTKLLRFYFDFQPITRKIILFLKTWSSHFDFANYRAISNYALCLMVIFYLQTRKFMYSVSQLRNMYKGPPKMIKGWDCTFYDNLESIRPLPCDLSCIEILRDFFLYYANFNYNEEVICPLLGRTIKKNNFHLSEDCNGLPEEMKCYKDYIQSNTDPELFRSLSSLCVQDPFDLSHNLTKAAPPHTVIKFSKACQISYKSLNDILNNHL